ncbi:hypothetical protein GSI_12126 [Ganoderma sinense ZZ0214-1]|uniref:DJ-1/PfpI domain-containing protein n=1 Tax=Ganoderma sinense ZZ0214-1 TaxID=1077348 RepID=A0A2G8RXX9_9APHY|nr:hypothetical protein GSI_12126 [Ganoderma sinense ZZ0214-1]
MFERLSAFLLWAVVLFPVFIVAQQSNATTPEKFGILLFPGFEPLDVFGPAERPSVHGPSLRAMNAYNSSTFQSVVPTHTLATVPADLEVLLIPRGLGTRSPDLNATIDWVRATYPALHSLITASWNKMIVYGTNVTWDKQARWVQDGNVWSSGGVSAGIDVTLGFLAHTWGEDVARSTANQIEYEWRNDPNWDVFGYVW